MECPKIIFVEGPTGVGKGYFINQLSLKLKEHNPKLRINLLEAKTWALGQGAVTEDRKYTIYNTDTDKIKGIVDGHIGLIYYIKSILSSGISDLVIVDRSFLSFIAYNLYEDKDKELREKYISHFKETYNQFIPPEYSSLSVQLISGKPTLKTISLLENRIKERGEDKAIDLKWLRTLLHNYSVYRVENILPTTYHETLTSNGADEIIKTYFTPESS